MTSSDKVKGGTVTLRAVHKQYDRRSVLKDIDLDVRSGEFVTIVGRSGSGKSTLLRILCGLEQASSGTAHIEATTSGSGGSGRSSGPEAGSSVRVVFQEPRLLPWRTVLQNVLIGMPRGAGAKAHDVLQRVGMLERANDFPGVLSGGQKQRVALARALVHEPTVMLLDEPFGALDALTRVGAQKLVESLWERHGFTAILVTHDVEEAVLLGDRVLVFEDGRIVDQVVVDRPRPRGRADPHVGRLTELLLERILHPSAEPTEPAPRERSPSRMAARMSPEPAE